MAVLIKQFTFAGQRRAAGGAQKKPRIELRFELLHVSADGGAANAEPVTRLREAAFVGHGEKRNDAGVARGKAARERVVGKGGGRLIVRHGRHDLKVSYSTRRLSPAACDKPG